MTKFDELIEKLKELFELDKADLDFGIHRIIKSRHREILRYLQGEQGYDGPTLKKKVTEALGDLAEAGQVAEVEHLKSQIVEEFGRRAFNEAGDLTNEEAKTHELGRRWLELQDGQGAHGQRGIDQLETEVYSHLLEFFSRYYEDGDFISLRRTRAGAKPYAIPYSGEEVVLHWANKDQHYIKSSEELKNYTFTLEEMGTKYRVHFKCTRMDPVENNNKAHRAFVLDEENQIEDGGTTLVVPFHFKIFSRKPTEKQHVATLEESLSALLSNEWKTRLNQDDTAYTGTGSRTILQKQLQSYTRNNNSDYFVHNNLGGFLRQELDFYIKNEIMYLDDVDNRPADYLAAEVRKIKTIRCVAKDLIAFLAQFEDFQKKLWLKKKFVTECHYCVTLDRIIEHAPDLLAEIATNHAQHKEWKIVYGIENVSADEKFLQRNRFLLIDTQFFSKAFERKLLSKISDIDAQCNGILVHAENFQALNFLQESYRDQASCVYIDPPYNTGSDEFPYKDGYQQSSWITLNHNRARLARVLMSRSALFFFQIGDDEAAHSRMLLDSVFDERKNSAVVRRGIKNVQAQFGDIDKLNTGHDIIHIYSKSKGNRHKHLWHKLDEEKPGKWDTFWRGTERPTMRYPLFGQNPERGQWRWEEMRSKNAARNYENFLERESAEKSLDEWYAENLQSGVDLDFVRINDEGVVQYYVPPQNFRLVSDNWLDVSSSGTFTDFPHEKNLDLLRRIVHWNCNTSGITLDYFAGSGTTGHAVISLNREDQGKRKYVLVEMGGYFDTALKPRIQKVVYSPEWKDGQPTRRDAGISHCFKYLRLESYEDTLNNLELEDRSADLLGLPAGVQEEYLIRYMLDVETRGSLINLQRFQDPWGSTLKIYDRETGEARPKVIDLVETFNYLLGLRVREQKVKDGFLTVEGENPAGETVLIIWRKLAGESDWPITDNAALQRFLADELRVNTADTEYAAIYINGDTTLDDPHKKILLTEQAFHDLMFADTE